MNTHTRYPPSYEFYLRDIDTRVLVEETAAGVIIRMSRNTLSERRKASFLHELAAEGFIEDSVQWSPRDVRWLVDAPRTGGHRVEYSPADRFMIRLFVASGLSLLLMFALLFSREYLAH